METHIREQNFAFFDGCLSFSAFALKKSRKVLASIFFLLIFAVEKLVNDRN